MKRSDYYFYVIELLALYSLIPMAPLMFFFQYVNVVLMAIFIDQLMYKIIKLPKFFHHLYQTLLGILKTFQGPMKKFHDTEPRKFNLLLFVVFLFFPIEHVYLTQWVAVYIMSLFCYQFSVIAAKNPDFLKEELEEFDPLDDGETLSPLEIIQMKLVTMITVSITTFMAVTHMQSVGLFFLVPLCFPFIQKAFHIYISQIFRLKFKDKKPTYKSVKGVTILCSFFLLLINYKYEQYILNFLATLYFSLLLSQVAFGVYQTAPTGQINTPEDFLDLFYNADLLYAFWAMTVVYEITCIVYVPRIFFIAMGVLLGMDPTLEMSRNWYYAKPNQPEESLNSSKLNNSKISRRSPSPNNISTDCNNDSGLGNSMLSLYQ